MHSTRQGTRSGFLAIVILATVCAGMLLAAWLLAQRTRALGVAHAGEVVTSGEATALTGHHAGRAPVDDGPSSGPQAGEIPTDQHLGPSADVPAVSRLDHGLRNALISAREEMRRQGIPMWITSGWRTSAYQRRLYDEAVASHGVQYAITHVATPGKTEHTSGNAVDIAPTAADDWLARNGARFGLCQTYANEMWHFELTAEAGTCPTLKTDARG